MSESQPPKVIWGKSTNPELISAWEDIENVGSEFTREEFLSATRLKDRLGEDTPIVLPLTHQPDKVEALFDVWGTWSQVAGQGKKVSGVEFDEATEEAIANDPAIIKLLASRKPGMLTEKQEAHRNEVSRERCALYLGRLATYNNKDEIEPTNGGDTSDDDPALENVG